MPDDLYETDPLRWAEQQSKLLHRLSRGEGVNDVIDWPNVIEEIHDVGLSELHACESLLAQAVLRILKIRGWPEGPVRHWQSELLGFLAGAQRRFSPSMRPRIALDDLYRKALRQVELLEIDGLGPRPLPRECPFPLDDLLADDPDLATLTAPA